MYIGCYSPDESIDRPLRGRTLAIVRDIETIDRNVVSSEEGDAYFRSQVRGLCAHLKAEAAVDKL